MYNSIYAWILGLQDQQNPGVGQGICVWHNFTFYYLQ